MEEDLITPQCEEKDHTSQYAKLLFLFGCHMTCNVIQNAHRTYEILLAYEYSA